MEELRDELARRLVKLSTLSARIGVSASYLSLLTTGKRPIKAAVALVLEEIGIETAEYWLILQLHYDLAQCRNGNKAAEL